MSDNPKEVHQGILKELTCLSCNEYMEPPIFLCKKGHNACCNCLVTLDKCYICKETVLFTRNLSLERLSNQTLYPCKNRNRGCNKSLNFELYESHKENCIYGDNMCIFTKVSGIVCTWAGTLSEMKRHILEEHIFVYRRSCSVAMYQGKTASILRDLVNCTEFYQAVFTLEEVFYVTWIRTENTLSCLALCLGDKEKALGFRYSVSIYDEYLESDVMSSVTQSYFDDVDDIIEKGICISINYDMVVQRYLSLDGNLQFEVEICQHEFATDEEIA